MQLEELLNEFTVDVRFLTNDELKMIGWEDKPNVIGISIAGIVLIPVVEGNNSVPINDNIPAQYEFSFNEETIFPTIVGYVGDE